MNGAFLCRHLSLALAVIHLTLGDQDFPFLWDHSSPPFFKLLPMNSFPQYPNFQMPVGFKNTNNDQWFTPVEPGNLHPVIHFQSHAVNNIQSTTISSENRTEGYNSPKIETGNGNKTTNQNNTQGGSEVQQNHNNSSTTVTPPTVTTVAATPEATTPEATTTEATTTEATTTEATTTEATTTEATTTEATTPEASTTTQKPVNANDKNLPSDLQIQFSFINSGSTQEFSQHFESTKIIIATGNAENRAYKIIEQTFVNGKPVQKNDPNTTVSDVESTKTTQAEEGGNPLPNESSIETNSTNLRIGNAETSTENAEEIEANSTSNGDQYNKDSDNSLDGNQTENNESFSTINLTTHIIQTDNNDTSEDPEKRDGMVNNKFFFIFNRASKTTTIEKQA